jgi:C-terminal processing protease CtpA/Prc
MESADGLGFQLSGNVPPVTVVHVKPGGQAKLAGIKVGDVILEVNGINCRKRVEATQLTDLKLLGQTQPKNKVSVNYNRLHKGS